MNTTMGNSKSSMVHNLRITARRSDDLKLLHAYTPVLHVSDEMLRIYPVGNKVMHYVQLYRKRDRDFFPEDEVWSFEEGREKFSMKKGTLSFHRAVHAASKEAESVELGMPITTVTDPCEPNRKLSVGFLGLGGLGRKIVKQLLTNGHHVTLWNRSFYKCYEMVELGCVTKASPQKVVEDCNVTFCCVSDTAAVQKVILAANGAIHGVSGGKCLIVLTTMSPEMSSYIQVAVEGRGGLYLEAPMFPVIGETVGNSLMSVVAGSRNCLDICSDLFRTFVKDLFYVGCVPNGNKIMLLVKSVSGATLAALAETLALAEKCDVSTDMLFQIIKCTQIASPFLISKAEVMLEPEKMSEEDVFPLAHFSNDLTSTLNFTSNASTPILSAAKQVFVHSILRGCSQKDVSAVYLKYTEPF